MMGKIRYQPKTAYHVYEKNDGNLPRISAFREKIYREKRFSLRIFTIFCCGAPRDVGKGYTLRVVADLRDICEPATMRNFLIHKRFW